MKNAANKILKSHRFRPLVWLGIIAAALIIAVIVADHVSAPSPSLPAEGTTLTISGEAVCLPHKDTTGPQTEECAFGLKSGNKYYSLSDSTEDYSLVSQLKTGDTVKVTGTFKSHPNSKYQDIGTITITSIDQ